MPGVRRPSLAVEAERRNREQLARLGGDLKSSRIRQGMSQAALGARVGVGRMVESRMERGLGGGVTLDAWQRVGLAVGRPLVVGFQRDIHGETADAGHLAIQELVIRLGRQAGFGATFELPTRPAEPWRSVDVGLRDDRRRILIIGECWNTIGDLGAAVRASARKLAEADGLAAALWGEEPATVGLVWIVRATARNRALVARYPEIFSARFQGSSAGWARTVQTGSPPPADPGLVWCDRQATRLLAWRRRARAGPAG